MQEDASNHIALRSHITAHGAGDHLALKAVQVGVSGGPFKVLLVSGRQASRWHISPVHCLGLQNFRGQAGGGDSTKIAQRGYGSQPFGEARILAGFPHNDISGGDDSELRPSYGKLHQKLAWKPRLASAEGF